MDRAQAGRAARKKGLDFEGDLKRLHDQLAAAGLAKIWKAEPQARMIGGRWYPVGKGPADWFGAIAAGNPVYFESKVRESTGKTPARQFTLDKRDAHQLDELRKMASIVPLAICFVIVAWVFEGEAEIIVHPIQTIWERKIERDLGISCVDELLWYTAIQSESYTAREAIGRYRDGAEIDF